MKIKNLIIISALAISFAFGGKKETTKQEEFTPPTSEPAVVAQDPIAEGAALVKGSDCKTCHHATNKIIGPSHTDVAKKYDFTAANVKLIADKIKNGGQGVWGQIPMTPHPDITQADAEKMARYVLSLDGETEH